MIILSNFILPLEVKVPVSIVMSDLAAKGIQYIPCFVFSLSIFFRSRGYSTERLQGRCVLL